MSKRYLGILFVTTLFACSQSYQNVDISGTWLCKDKFHSAKYEVFLDEEQEYKGLVLSYNDGTSKYKYDSLNEFFIFEKLRSEKGHYAVDGISGATNKTNADLEIHPISDDSLEVKRLVGETQVREYWVRKKK